MLQQGANPNAYGSTKYYQIQGEPPILSEVMRHDPANHRDYREVILLLLEYGAAKTAKQQIPSSFRGFDAMYVAEHGLPHTPPNDDIAHIMRAYIDVL